jgi:uncharacterized membrane protein YbhN (UPF0104 family)
MSKKTKLQLTLGFIITAIIVYFSIRALGRLHPGVVFHSDINWTLAAVSTVVFMYANYIRGLAFTRGIDPNIDRWTAFQIMGIGHAANMVLPLHAGEGLRFAFFPGNYTTRRRTELLLVSAAADVVAIIMLSLLAVPFSGFKDLNLSKALWILAFLCIATGILFAAVIYFVPRLRNYAKSYMNLDTLKMLFWVILSWVLLLLSTWIGLVAFGFHIAESMRMSLAVFATTNIINFIPASPGAIGLFEYGTILGLGSLGISQPTALSAGLLLHLIQYIALLPMGTVLYIMALHGKYGDTIRNMWNGSKRKSAKLKK